MMALIWYVSIFKKPFSSYRDSSSFITFIRVVYDLKTKIHDPFHLFKQSILEGFIKHEVMTLCNNPFVGTKNPAFRYAVHIPHMETVVDMK